MVVCLAAGSEIVGDILVRSSDPFAISVPCILSIYTPHNNQTVKPAREPDQLQLKPSPKQPIGISNGCCQMAGFSQQVMLSLMVGLTAPPV